MDKGFTQKYGINFEEIFASISRKETFRFILSLATHKIWTIPHMDVKSDFLNGYFNEEFYVEKT